MKLDGDDPPKLIPPLGAYWYTLATAFGFDLSANQDSRPAARETHPPPVEVEVDATAGINSVEADPPNAVPPLTAGATVIDTSGVPARTMPPEAVTVMVRATSAAPPNASPPVPS